MTVLQFSKACSPHHGYTIWLIVRKRF